MSILKRAFYLLSSVAISFTFAANIQQTTNLNLENKISDIEKTNYVSSATYKASSDRGKQDVPLQLAPAWTTYDGILCVNFGKNYSFNWNDLLEGQKVKLIEILGEDIKDLKLYICIQDKDNLFAFDENNKLLPRPHITALDKYVKNGEKAISGGATTYFKYYSNGKLSELKSLELSGYSIHDGRFSPNSPQSAFDKNNMPDFIVSKTEFQNNWSVGKPDDFIAINIFATAEELNDFNACIRTNKDTFRQALEKISCGQKIIEMLEGDLLTNDDCEEYTDDNCSWCD